MIDVLESIQPISLRKRIKGEFFRMEFLYDKINIIKEDGKIIFEVEKTYKNQKKIIYKFVISIHYPYKPPDLYINNKNYGQYLRCPNKFLNVLKYISNIECFCCSSCTCPGNWTPSITLKYIIEESEYNSKIKHNIMIKIFLDQIKDKYLISDINLDCWLFHIARPDVIKPGTKYLI